jgi:hypothetical protein
LICCHNNRLYGIDWDGVEVSNEFENLKLDEERMDIINSFGETCDFIQPQDVGWSDLVINVKNLCINIGEKVCKFFICLLKLDMLI